MDRTTRRERDNAPRWDEDVPFPTPADDSPFAGAALDANRPEIRIRGRRAPGRGRSDRGARSCSGSEPLPAGELAVACGECSRRVRAVRDQRSVSALPRDRERARRGQDAAGRRRGDHRDRTPTRDDGLGSRRVRDAEAHHDDRARGRADRAHRQRRLHAGERDIRCGADEDDLVRSRARQEREHDDASAAHRVVGDRQQHDARRGHGAADASHPTGDEGGTARGARRLHVRRATPSFRRSSSTSTGVRGTDDPALVLRPSSAGFRVREKTLPVLRSRRTRSHPSGGSI